MQAFAMNTLSTVSDIAATMLGSTSAYWATISIFVILCATLFFTIREVLAQYRSND